MKDVTHDREAAIIQLVKEYKISDQKQLISLLNEQYSISTNQAAISRDLRKLKISKMEIDGELVYYVTNHDVTAEILKLAIVDIRHNESMIVIKTQPALAAFVGDRVDSYSDLPLLGCLSGENMVFVAPASVATIRQTYLALCKKLNFKGNHV